MTSRPPVRWLILLLGAVLTVSAIAGTIGASIPLPPTQTGERPVLLFTIGLELAVVACGVFAVLVGLDRFKDGRAITLLCIGAGAAVCSMLGVISAGQAVFESYKINLMPFRNARLGVGALFVLLAAMELVTRRPAVSLPLLAKGLLWGAPLAIAAALWMSGFLPAQFAGLQQMPQIIVSVIAFVIFCVLISASAHYLIRAFAEGVEAAEKG